MSVAEFFAQVVTRRHLALPSFTFLLLLPAALPLYAPLLALVLSPRACRSSSGRASTRHFTPRAEPATPNTGAATLHTHTLRLTVHSGLSRRHAVLSGG